MIHMNNGTMIEGWFKDGEPYGYRRRIEGGSGQYSYCDSIDGVRQGYGRYYWPSGAKQIAIYENNKAEGYGKCYCFINRIQEYTCIQMARDTRVCMRRIRDKAGG